MEKITSAENKTVKHIIKLKQKKYRDEYGEFFIEGYKNVLDSASAMPDSVKLIVLSDSVCERFGGEFSDFETVVVSDGIYSKITDTENGQGVLSVNAKPKMNAPLGDRAVLLDRVRDPGNVGTILRTAAACGYSVILNNCADVFAPKTVRSAMSAVVKAVMRLDVPVAELKDLGYELIVADMKGENVFQCAHSEKYCVAIGNEAHGVADEIAACADKLMCVPQDGMESLNAAVAAAVMMFALRYQNI